MKLKITITGPRVHGVGYRILLGKIALSLAIPGLTAYNWWEGDAQQVVALFEGEPERLSMFKKKVEENKPVLAEVSSITVEDFDGEVGRANEYAMSLTFEQFETAIPILYRIAENTALIPEIAVTTKATLEISKTNLEISKTNLEISKTNLETSKATLEISKTNLEISKATLEEIKGLRDDIQPGYSSRFQQLQEDMKAVKARLGMT